MLKTRSLCQMACSCFKVAGGNAVVGCLCAVQIQWLNNPSRDKGYAHLSKNLGMLLNMYPGRLAPMAVNLMHMVSVGDPLSPECIHLAGIMSRLQQR